MVKILVTIDLENRTAEEILDNKAEWFHTKPGHISVDGGYLKVDPTDNSFYLFEFVGIQDPEVLGEFSTTHKHSNLIGDIERLVDACFQHLRGWQGGPDAALAADLQKKVATLAAATGEVELVELAGTFHKSNDRAVALPILEVLHDRVQRLDEALLNDRLNDGTP